MQTLEPILYPMSSDPDDRNLSPTRLFLGFIAVAHICEFVNSQVRGRLDREHYVINNLYKQTVLVQGLAVLSAAKS